MQHKDTHKWADGDMVGAPVVLRPDSKGNTPPPAGINPRVWSNMTPEQRQQAAGVMSAPPEKKIVEHKPADYASTDNNPGLLNEAIGGIHHWLSGPEYSESGGQLKPVDRNGAPTEPAPEPKAEPDVPIGVQQAIQEDQANNAGVPMGQSQYVAAHEVAGADPERQAALQGAFANEAEAVAAGGEAAANVQDVTGQGQMQAAEQESADLDQAAANQKARQEYLEGISKDIENDSKDMANAKVDPDRWWASRSTPQRILGIIALALGGFGAASRGGRNGAADMIQSAIENDISAQRGQIENKWGALKERHMLLSDKASQYGSMDIAEKQQVAARLQGALLAAQGAAARATSPVERAHAAQLVAQLQEKAIGAGIQLNKWVSAGYVGGPAGGAGNGLTKDIKPSTLVRIGNQLVDTGDEVQARALNALEQSRDNLTSTAEKMMSLLNDPWTAVPGNPKRGQLLALGKEVSVEDMKSLSGSGTRAGKGILDYLNIALGNYMAHNPVERAQARKSLETFIEKAKADRAESAQSLAGSWVVRRAVDPNHPNQMQIIGRFDPNSVDSGTKSAIAPPKTLKLLGQ